MGVTPNRGSGRRKSRVECRSGRASCPTTDRSAANTFASRRAATLKCVSLWERACSRRGHQQHRQI
ncbi:hypothetical protein DBR24_23025 [Pseudomonas sp. HMWF006]|nr:hypothetical protein DBR24_23025 [Pseudomonas sp. HMWF006]PTT68780.1 hypothetical protein DBR26_12830 [Pseudomonas sp. HMWF007]PTT93460.1 hypothetical protein DBR29_06870 [Pseudomonas sp. HMWF005]